MSRQCWLRVGAVCLLLVLPATVRAEKIYWTDDGPAPTGGSIYRAALDGTFPETLVTGDLEYGGDLALDVVQGKLYWVDSSVDAVRRANVDGSNVETLLTSTHPNLAGIALDLDNRRMYITAYNDALVLRANLDGTNVQTIVTESESYGTYDIEVDVAGGKIYWSNSPAQEIRRANLDGSEVETVLIIDTVNDEFDFQPRGIGLDPSAGHVYWGAVNFRGAPSYVTDGRVQRANLDGSGVVTLTESIAYADRVALDLVNDHIYVVDGFFRRIVRYNLDGSFASGYAFPETNRTHGIALDLTPCESQSDCNNNGTADCLDIDAGTSGDCNANFIPDECEPDYDGDGTTDDCDDDIDGDGVLNTADVCNYTPPTIAPSLVDPDGSLLGDLDGDCDVDMADLEALAARFTGPRE